MTSTSVKVIWADFGSISTRLTRNLLIFNPCAQDETRTHTILRPLPPQSSVYTNFTTCACPEQDSNLHTSRHAHLKRTRLPIPPSGRACINTSRDSRQAARLRLRIVLRFFGLQNYVLHPEVFDSKIKIKCLPTRKRVQKYCFFLT